jgi:hypothetical protein
VVVGAMLMYEIIIADREQLLGFAWMYQSKDRYIDAEMSFKQVLQSGGTRLGPEHRETLKTMYLVTLLMSIITKRALTMPRRC